MTVRVAGSLWSVPPGERSREARRLASAGLDVLHWDVADGLLGPAGGVDAETARRLTAGAGTTAEAHLMVGRPLSHVDAWTDFCDVVAVHREAAGWRAALDRIERRGARPALALSPGTGTGAVPSRELAVLVMSVLPGHGGARFRPDTCRRLRELVGSSRSLGVDGGVDLPAARASRAAGASWLVSGTALLAAEDPADWLAAVRRPTA